MSRESSPDAPVVTLDLGTPDDVPPVASGPPGAIAGRPRQWHRRLSLRARLLAVVTVLLVVALVATGVVTIVILDDVLVDQKDEQLTTEFPRNEQGLARLVADGPGPGGPDGPTQFYVRLTPQSGQPAESLPGSRIGEAPQLSARDLAATEPVTARSESGATSWRVLSKPTNLAGGPVTISLALPLDDVDATLGQLAQAFVLLAVLVVLACVLLGWEALRRAFGPLRQVEAVATAFGDGDTSRRVESAWPGTEVGRLGSSVNAMLDRIETTLAAREASEARMRRFVGDASHELRTPLSAVRGFAELYRMGAVADDEVRTTFRRIEDESTRMGGLVDDLLTLARMDERRPMRRDPLDLLALAADAVHDARALAPDRTVTLRGLDGSPSPTEAPAVGDDAHLRQVVTNLLANAIRHTPAGTPIELGVGRRDEWVLWQVVDHGPGIDPEASTRIFERFYRADASRSRTAGGGSGLGLAIVTAIVEAHAGAARVVPTPGGGATFEVALPAADVVLPGAPEVPDEAPDDGPDDGSDDGSDEGPDEAPGDRPHPANSQR